MSKPKIAMAAGIAAGLGALGTSVSDASAPDFSFALIGDVPYGTADAAVFSDLVADVNDDDAVELVAHAGDVKAGITACTDTVLRERFEDFQQFDDPFWFTPGDNEWTDCQGPSPAFEPLERLNFLRSLFFPEPTRTTGGTTRAVASQSSDARYPQLVEHTRFHASCVTFGSIHQTGSGNGGLPWVDETAAQTQNRIREMETRNAAAAAWVDEIFDAAEDDDSDAVFLLTHARPRTNAPYRIVHDRIAARAGAFDGPVIVANGDEHQFVVENDFLGLDNLTRWQTPGGFGAVDQWVKVEVDCDSADVFSAEPIDIGVDSDPTASGAVGSFASVSELAVRVDRE
ncbi:MAG: hypothetical protein AB8G26_08890 [Ilumatobacter sp.]